MSFARLGRGNLVLATAVLALGGCGAAVSESGSNEGAKGEAVPVGRSGQRLSALAYQAGDAVQFRHFHDELLGFDCAFGADAAGMPRCFPQHGARIVYLDAACTQPAIRDYGVERGEWIVEVNNPCPGELPTYGGVYVAGEQMYEEGIAGSEDYQVYERAGAACNVAPPEAKSNPAVYELLTKDAGELVSGSIASFETAGGLRVQRVVATDGAEADLGVTLHDGTACTLQRDGLCLAQPQVDAGCRAPSAIMGVSDAELRDIGQGPLHLEVYELHGVAADDTELTFRVPAGQIGTFLTRTGTCAVWKAGDGSLRCVDENGEVVESGYFADAGCQTRLYRDYARGGQQVDAERLANLRLIERGEGYSVDGVSSLERHEGGVYAFTNTVCSLVSPDELTQTYRTAVPTFLARRERLPLASLPLVKNARLD
jgi:hypothetical protein